MASKSNSNRVSDTNSGEDGSKSWSPPPPPSRPRRVKTIPNRLHHGVDRHIRGVSDHIPEAPSPNPKSKGVSFKEPVASSKPSKHQEPQGKGKQKATEIPKPPKSKRSKVTSTHEKGQSSSKQTGSQKSQGPQQPQEPSVIDNAIVDIQHTHSPPQGFATAPSTITPEILEKFKETFINKDFCAIIYVDLPKLKEECLLDLSPWLDPYDSLLCISVPFTPKFGKLYYFNMKYDNILDSEGEVVEERVTTSVKDVTFSISASILNKILKIDNPPPVPTIQFSNREIFEILRPGEPIPNDQLHHLSFNPATMPPIHRALWYIYSRNMVQKGGNFTHFTQKEYPLFAAFVSKVPLNLGHWIFKEMVKFKFGSRKNSHIPFPSLISVILFYHKIWYKGPADALRYPPIFGKAQLNLMRISFDLEGSGQSRAPSRSHARASQAQEAQSAPPPPQSSLPSDFDSRIKAIVDAAMASLSIRLEFEIGRLLDEVRRGNHEAVDAQDALKETVDRISSQTAGLSDHLVDLDARLSTHTITTGLMSNNIDRILAHLRIGSSSPAPSSSMPQPNPEQPSTEPTISAPSTFEDDKGGEKGNE